MNVSWVKMSKMSKMSKKTTKNDYKFTVNLKTVLPPRKFRILEKEF